MEEKDIKLLQKHMLVSYNEAYLLLKQNKNNTRRILERFLHEIA